jgi:aminomethyltransferase
VNEPAQKKTPLYDEHVKRGAKMVPFAGWLMPVQYTGIAEEHQAVRNNVGIFDISHMGQLVISGSAAATWLNTMLTNSIEKLDVGQGQYTFLLNDAAGIIDDLIVYRIGDTKFLLVVNAACVEEDFAWLDRHRSENVNLGDRSAHFGGVAIQGPRVAELFVNLPARNHIVDVEMEGMSVSIARTGYTGEDGIEVFFFAKDAANFWNTVLEK